MAGDSMIIAQAVARLRLDRGLSQEALAQKAGISRLALGNIERGAVEPRAKTLHDLADALGVPVGDLITPARPLETVRFRARARMTGREQVLAEVSRWLDSFVWLESALKARVRCPLEFGGAGSRPPEPKRLARDAREALGLGPKEAVRDICGLLEDRGVKVLRLFKSTEAFFGLSVGGADGGPAVVVNTWDRISVERWIFTAAHELGHLLLHEAEYVRSETEEPKEAERQADVFASYFLMPEKAFEGEWEETRGHPLVVRVMKVKRIFRVSYKTVLYRLVETGRADKSIWQQFQAQHKRHFGKTLKKADEPHALNGREFAWNWSSAAEPDGLSASDFVEDRLSRLVRSALEKEVITTGRAAEILGVTREEMRLRAREWAQ